MPAEGFGWLSRMGDVTALLEEAGAEISYAELARRCEAFAEGYGEGRQLVLLEASNDVASVVAYLAALAVGHVVILTGDADSALDDRILRTFSPSIVCRRGELRRTGDAPPARLHPDLALLLPTSGSTGSPKLVRLSHQNLKSNAEAIVEYLAITAQDRAISSLPLHYSYGLSVLNSHLRAGASVILTDMSVTQPEFWSLFRRKRATSIAGVPYSYELFERIGLRDDPPETLRVMTQAGGRLAPELVKTYAAFGRANDVRFYAMYGQTEAAPRMAYLPPGLAAEHPDCIGLAIPGGSLSLLDEDGGEVTQAGVAGELVYRGPNVMMGYAERRADLARGPELEALRTGDLAVRVRDDLFRIVGRVSRFVKIVGRRVDLDDLEATLSGAGHRAYVAGTDAQISVCVVGDSDGVRDLVAARCGLPPGKVIAFPVTEEPRLPGGKVDYQAILAMGEEPARKDEVSAPGGGVIAAVYASALGIAPPPADATFASLGGDSLSYVNASIGLEQALGHLPLNWETMPIASLEAMASPGRPAKARWRWISSEVPVRVIALLLIMAGHAVQQLDPWLHGGANILFALAGYSLARFQGEALLKGSTGPAIQGAVYRVILPYLLCVTVLLLGSHSESSISWFFLLSVFMTKPHGTVFVYWFIETLFHALLVTCGLFRLPPVRRYAAARPFGFSLALIAGAALLIPARAALWPHDHEMHFTVDAWLYAYYLGWGARIARGPWQKALLVVLAALFSGAQYGLGSSREILLTLGLAVVMFTPRLKLPNLAGRAVLELAAASYFIYLAHAFTMHVLIVSGSQIRAPMARIALLWSSSIVLGLAFARTWNFVVPRARRHLSQRLGGLRAAPATSA